MEILLMMAMLSTGASSSHNIEQYCKATTDGFGSMNRCIRRNKNAEQEISHQSYPDNAIRDYCKEVITPPAWGDILACYKNQVKMKKKYAGLAKSNPQKAGGCEKNNEPQNWIGKVHCLSPYIFALIAGMVLTLNGHILQGAIAGGIGLSPVVQAFLKNSNTRGKKKLDSENPDNPPTENIE